MKLLVLALAALAVVFALKGVAVRQDLVTERQAIEADWTEVNAALDQRVGVVPDLTSLVQAEAPAEVAVVHGVLQAREALNTAHTLQEKIQANGRLDEALARLMLQVENYPKLDSGKRYGDLLEALKSSDYKIAVARRKYNEAVEHYNARIELFPNNVVASVTRLRKVDAYFQTPAI